MLGAAGSPHLDFRSILIGGTNGKGSVAAMAEALLRANGPLTGLYTSPHLVDPAERIRIGGRPIDPELFERCAQRVLPLAELTEATFFESLTAVAFFAFAEAGVETAAVEVGLGGRLDATNVLQPDACVITNVSLDHADWLGDSLEAIATEKAGIIKRSVPLITGRLSGESRTVVESRAAEVGAPLVQLGRDFGAAEVTTGCAGTRFTYWCEDGRAPDGAEFAVPLPGDYQADNAALALSAVREAGHSLAVESSRLALRNLDWPGRFQLLNHSGTTLVLDVAHNPAGAENLAAALDRIPLPLPRVGLIGILGDKPWREMLTPLLDRLDEAVFTSPPSAPAERAWDPFEARAAVPAASVEVERRFPEALDRALELAGSGTVLVTGSNHTVGDALREIEARKQRG